MCGQCGCDPCQTVGYPRGGGGPAPCDVNPLPDGVAAPGVGLAYSRCDHVHPAGGGGAKFETMKVERAAAAGSGTQNIALSDDLAASVFNGRWAFIMAVYSTVGPGSVGHSAPNYGAEPASQALNSQFGPAGGVTVNHITRATPIAVGGEVRDLVLGAGYQIQVTFPVAGQVRVQWFVIGAGLAVELTLMIIGG